MVKNEVRMLEFTQHGDERGHLVVVEDMKDIPFEIKARILSLWIGYNGDSRTACE